MSVQELVLNTLSSEAFVSVNRQLLKYFEGDPSPALLLSELLSMFRYHRQRGDFDELTQSFPASSKYLQRSLSLSTFKQRRLFGILEERGLIATFMQGMPASRRVILHFEFIAIVMEQRPTQAQMDSKDFYAELSKSAESGDKERIKTATGNMSRALSDAVLCLSLHPEVTDLLWTPRNAGLLRTMVQYYTKRDAVGFDYRRLEKLITGAVAVGDKSLTGVLQKMLKMYKGVHETPVNQRSYHVDDILFI